MSLFRSRRGRRRNLAFLEVIFLLVAFTSLTWFGYMTAQRLLDNSWQEYKFEQTLAGAKPTLSGYIAHLRNGKATPPHAQNEQPVGPAAEPTAPVAPSSPERRKLKRAELVGRIEIPRIKVSAVVKEGVDSKTLSRAVGHVPYTPLPGEKGNVGVAAHRDTHFRGLRNVRKGDVIRVTTLEGVYLYEVDSLKIVWPKNVEVLDPTPDPRITLVTCYPFNFVGSAPKRFIVQGKQVGFEELSAQAKTQLEQGSSARQPKAGS